MGRVAILTDSNSGITQAESEELGISVIPMPFFIDGEMYLEDITLTQEEFYKRLKEDAEISTSMPSPGETLERWDKLLEEYDEIVFIPMSSGLSSFYQTASMLSEDYDGKVQVVNNQRISVTMRQSALDAKAYADKGYDAKKIKDILESVKMESSIYITLDTLKYLKKGGRITPAAAAIGTILLCCRFREISLTRSRSAAASRQPRKQCLAQLRKIWKRDLRRPRRRDVFTLRRHIPAMKRKQPNGKRKLRRLFRSIRSIWTRFRTAWHAISDTARLP